MKKIIIATCFVLGCFINNAQNNPIFFGGNSSGWNTQNFTQNYSSIFSGGEGAGWNKSSFNQAFNNIFSGGENDGWVFNSFTQSGSNIFNGGENDGWSNAIFLQAGSDIFNGGIDDGWASNLFLQPGNDIFTGGENDGWAYINFLQSENNIFNGGENDGWASTYRPMGPLPVSLISFTVQKINNSEGLLKWKTSSEINSSHFEIERSNDAFSFEKIGLVAAAGNSALPVEYDFNDLNPARGFNYYRLKQVDIDGRFVYTPTRLLRFDFIDDKNISYYPNPTTGQLNISITNSNNTEQKLITVSNSAGAVVNQIKVVSNNTEIIKLNLGGLPRGIYFIQLKSSTINSTRRIIVN